MNTDACKPVGEGADAPNVRMDGKMTAPWMPPLPPADNAVEEIDCGPSPDIPGGRLVDYVGAYTADEMRQAQADAARAALEQAAKVCDEFQRQHGDDDNHGAFLALRIRALAKEIT